MTNVFYKSSTFDARDLKLIRDALYPFKHILNIISSYFYLKVKINAPPPISLLFTKGAVHFSKLGRYIDLGPLKKLFE